MADRVIIRGDAGYKFVVLKAQNGDMAVFADDDGIYDYHYKLVAQYCREHRVDARCLGGGRIMIDRKKQLIAIRGSSGDFGVEPDRAQTIRMIQVAFPDFTVIDSDKV